MTFRISDPVTDKRRLSAALGIVLASGFIATTLINHQVSRASIRGTLIASADRALYEAKARGRNVVRVADPVSRPPA